MQMDLSSVSCTLCFVNTCHLLSPLSLFVFCVRTCMCVQIQRALLRNNQTQRFSQKQALRLHQGLVTSTAEQVCVCVFVHMIVNKLRFLF